MCAGSLDLLGSVCFGTIAFAVQAVPVLRPASHVVEDDDLIVGVHGDAFTAGDDGFLVRDGELPPGHPGWTSVILGTIAGYVAEASDRIWSVVATGMAFPITDAAESAYYADRLSGPRDQLIRVHLEAITTYRQATMALLTGQAQPREHLRDNGDDLVGR
jgi:Pyridoxamine 5'-phosphate oxidase